MSVLRLSGFVLTLLLLASLSALASPPPAADKALMQSTFRVVTAQGAMQGGVVRNDLLTSNRVTRDVIQLSAQATEIIPFTGVNVPEMGQ